MRARRVATGAAIAAIVIVVLVLLFGGRFERSTAQRVVGHFIHSKVTIGGMHVGLGGASFSNVDIRSKSGAPFATIKHIAMTYNLHDLLHGGNRRYGLKSITIDAPSIRLVRRPNGTYNFPKLALPKSKSNGKPAPLIFTGSVHDGSVTFVNQSSRGTPLKIERINAALHFNTAARSNFTVSMAYVSSQKSYPIRGRGVIDAAAGYENAHITAAAIPIAHLANYLAATPAIRVTGGVLQSLSAHYYAMGRPGIKLHPEIAATTQLRGLVLSVKGLPKPVSDVHGRLDVYSNGITTNGVTGSIAGTPVRLHGGIYDLKAPKIDLVADGTASLAHLRQLSPALSTVHVNGTAAFRVGIAGSVKSPLTVASVGSPRIRYGTTVVEDVRALVALSGHDAHVLRAAARYGTASVRARGRVALQKSAPNLQLVARVDAPQILPGIPVEAFAVAGGKTLKTIAARGVLQGTPHTGFIDGTFVYAGTAGAALLNARGLQFNGIPIDNVIADVGLSGKSVNVYGAQAQVGGSALLGAGSVGTHAKLALSASNFNLAHLAASPLRTGRFSFGATIAGSLQAPWANAAMVLDSAQYRGLPVNAQTTLSYAGTTVRVAEATLLFDSGLASLDGTVGGIALRKRLTPRYDLNVSARAADIARLAALAGPSAVNIPLTGSLDADAHVSGSGRSPFIAGTFRVPEGTVHGLGFSGLSADLHGTASRLHITNGHVTVDTTTIAFTGEKLGTGFAGSIDAPHLNLADFNDYFNAAETLGGTGAAHISLSTAGGALSTSGNVTVRSARYKRFNLGTASAAWRTRKAVLALNAAVGGTSGRLRLKGTAVLPALGTSTLLRSTRLDIGATASGFNLATWLPLLGIRTPVSGIADASALVRGKYPDVDMSARVSLRKGRVAHLRIERFDVAAHATRGRVRVDSAVLQIPSLSATASGTFGLRKNAPLDLAARAVSPNLHALALAATGKAPPFNGALTTTVRITGNSSNPIVHDVLAITSARYRKLAIPRITGDVTVSKTSVAIRSAQLTLRKGTLSLHGAVPITISPFRIRNAPLSLTLSARQLAIADFSSLMPSGDTISGFINGTLAARGTYDAPVLGGAVSLTDAGFSGPMLATPLTNGQATVAFSGPNMSIQRLQARLGGGTITGSGAAVIPNARRLQNASFRMNLNANALNVDSPKYFHGVVSGTMSLAKRPGARPMVSGDLTIPTGRLALNAFLNFKKKAPSTKKPLDIGFDMTVHAGRDVRVQSPQVDVGATGSATLLGTLAAPKLRGTFVATGGTINLYRDFTLSYARLTFSPVNGIFPYINAAATTQIPSPSTFVRLHVTGLVPNSMRVAFSSDPPYDRTQILGLLIGAQAFGAVPGVASTGTGANGFSAGSEAQALALGQANQLLVRNVLEPLSAQLGSALGLQNFQLTNNFTNGGFGVNAVKAFGKNLDFVFAQTFGVPMRETLSLNLHLTNGSLVQLMTYQQPESSLFQGLQPYLLTINQPGSNQADLQPLTGAQGVKLTYQRKFDGP